MKTYKSASTQRPPEWDTVSSPDVVFHNYNIVEEPATEDNPTMYKYDVDRYTRVEYLEYENGQLRQTVNALLGVAV